MEEDASPKKGFSIKGWRPRWGHIAVALIIIVVGVLLTIWAIYYRDHSPTIVVQKGCPTATAKYACSAKSAPKKTTTPKTTPKPNTSSPSSGSVTNSSPSPHAGSASSTAPTPNTKPTLTNTGPGNVIGIFALTAVSGSVLHYLYTRRRLARKQT
jgi:hypothetical protein